jgi:hypothetical protein
MAGTPLTVDHAWGRGRGTHAFDTRLTLDGAPTEGWLRGSQPPFTCSRRPANCAFSVRFSSTKERDRITLLAVEPSAQRDEEHL